MKTIITTIATMLLVALNLPQAKGALIVKSEDITKHASNLNPVEALESNLSTLRPVLDYSINDDPDAIPVVIDARSISLAFQNNSGGTIQFNHVSVTSTNAAEFLFGSYGNIDLFFDDPDVRHQKGVISSTGDFDQIMSLDPGDTFYYRLDYLAGNTGQVELRFAPVQYGANPLNPLGGNGLDLMRVMNGGTRVGDLLGEPFAYRGRDAAWQTTLSLKSVTPAPEPTTVLYTVLGAFIAMFRRKRSDDPVENTVSTVSTEKHIRIQSWIPRLHTSVALPQTTDAPQLSMRG